MISNNRAFVETKTSEEEFKKYRSRVEQTYSTKLDMK